MTRLSYKRSAVLLASLAILATSCGGSTGQEDTTGASADNLSMALITSDPVGTNQFLKGILEGFEEAEEELDADGRVFESKGDPQSMQSNVDAAIRAEPDLIVLTGFSFLDIMNEAAPANPDQQFLIVDSCIPDPPPNVTCSDFRVWEASYLAGIEAAMLTKKGVVGNVGATDTPVALRWSKPFKAGMDATKPGIEYSRVVVGGQTPYTDPARAKELALSLYSGGADIIMSAAAAGNYGVFEAAEEKEFTVFGVDTNQCLDSPGEVIDNVIKNLDTATVLGIKDVLAGNTGHHSYGLAEDGVSVAAIWDDDELAASKCLIADHPEIVTAVRAAAKQIIDGTVVVDDPAAVQ